MAAYYHHKVQAIQIVNQNLDRHSNAVAYDVQVAIAVLAIIEVCPATQERQDVVGNQVLTMESIRPDQ